MTIKIIKTRAFKSLATLAFLSLLLSCGGGGGGSTGGADSGSPNNPARTASAFGPDPDTPEFREAKSDSHRFLQQSTFGPMLDDMSRVAHLGKRSWIDEQFETAPTLMLPQLQAIPTLRWNEYVNIWWRTAITAPDQLRQRVAFALSEIFVVSSLAGLGDEQPGLANYYDILVRNAFGNYRDLIEEITLNPVMGEYLSMKGNHKPDAEKSIRPDENYARELLQLFSIGLVQLNPDGSPKMGSDGVPLPTYDQDTVEGFAHVFTGWTFSNADNFLWPSQSDYISPMQPWEEFHDTGSKLLLNGKTISAGNTAQGDLKEALDNIFSHPNVGPFIAKHLIQRLVTSNPSPAYIKEVAAVFNANEDGIRGSLGSMIKTILLHSEAQNGHTIYPDTFGKLKEPLIRISNLWRAFPPDAIAAEFNYAWVSKDVGQGPLNSPSVFNFFTPGFSQPGMVRNQGLVSPEFEIHDESSMVRITNRVLANSIWSHNFNEHADNKRLAINISQEVAMEERSHEELLDHLNTLLLGGNMTEELREAAMEVMAGYPDDSLGPQRVVEVIFLIMASPEAAVQI